MQPVDQNQCLVLHLKDPLHIHLELEAQRRGMIIRHTFMKSKYPYLLYKMQKSRFNLQGTVLPIFFNAMQLTATSEMHDNAYSYEP